MKNLQKAIDLHNENKRLEKNIKKNRDELSDILQDLTDSEFDEYMKITDNI